MYKGKSRKVPDVLTTGVTPMAWLKSSLGLPETASWLGFGIQRLQDERFLVASGKKAGEWTEAVGADNGFLGWREVETLAASMSGVTIVLMFDMGDCVKVFPAR